MVVLYYSDSFLNSIITNSVYYFFDDTGKAQQKIVHCFLIEQLIFYEHFFGFFVPDMGLKMVCIHLNVF